MVYVPNVVSKQDMPPLGGYPKSQISRINNPRGPSGYVIFGAFFGAIIVGNYFVYLTNKQQREINDHMNNLRKISYVYFQAENEIEKSTTSNDSRITISLPKQKRYSDPYYSFSSKVISNNSTESSLKSH